jgi:hypothetical protein
VSIKSLSRLRTFILAAMIFVVILYAFSPALSRSDREVCGIWMVRDLGSLEIRVRLAANMKWESYSYYKQAPRSKEESRRHGRPTDKGTWRREGSKLLLVSQSGDWIRAVLTCDFSAGFSRSIEHKYSILSLSEEALVIHGKFEKQVWHRVGVKE